MTFSISGGYTLSRFTGTDVGIESRMGNCSRKLQFLRFRAAQEMKLKERRSLKNIFLMLAYPSLSVFFSRILYMTFSISGGCTLSRFTGTDVGIESRMGNKR